LQSSPHKFLIVFKGSQNTIFLEEAVKQVLANQNDIAKLPRMDQSWQRTKEKYFKSLKSN